jgi:hypothetical protein
MNARDVIAKVADDWCADPSYDYYAPADRIIALLREHPEAVRSLLSDELLADIRECSVTEASYSACGDRVLAWLDGEQ